MFDEDLSAVAGAGVGDVYPLALCDGGVGVFDDELVEGAEFVYDACELEVFFAAGHGEVGGFAACVLAGWGAAYEAVELWAAVAGGDGDGCAYFLPCWVEDVIDEGGEGDDVVGGGFVFDVVFLGCG